MKVKDDRINIILKMFALLLIVGIVSFIGLFIARHIKKDNKKENENNLYIYKEVIDDITYINASKEEKENKLIIYNCLNPNCEGYKSINDKNIIIYDDALYMYNIDTKEKNAISLAKDMYPNYTLEFNTIKNIDNIILVSKVNEEERLNALYSLDKKATISSYADSEYYLPEQLITKDKYIEKNNNSVKLKLKKQSINQIDNVSLIVFDNYNEKFNGIGDTYYVLHENNKLTKNDDNLKTTYTAKGKYKDIIMCNKDYVIALNENDAYVLLNSKLKELKTIVNPNEKNYLVENSFMFEENNLIMKWEIDSILYKYSYDIKNNIFNKEPIEE